MIPLTGAMHAEGGSPDCEIRPPHCHLLLAEIVELSVPDTT